MLNYINVLLLSLIILGKADVTDDNLKSQLVQEITQKIFNITSTALAKASPSLKVSMLDNIESQLKLSAHRFGVKGEKYVQLVMEGLKILTNNNSQNQSLLKEAATLSTSLPQYHKVLRIGDMKPTAPPQLHDAIVNEISEKVLRIAQTYSNLGETAEEKRLIIQNIRNKVLESAQLHHNKSHIYHEDVKAYTDLITRGMELMMKNLAQSKRSMFHSTENKHKDTEYSNQHNHIQDRMGYALKAVNKGAFDFTTPETVNYGVTTPMSCEAIMTQICTDIKSLNKYVCPHTGGILSLSNVCDGTVDCPNGADEQHCLEKAMTRMQRAIRVTTNVESYLLQDCFISTDNGILTKQNVILNDVLRKQMGFLQKYTDKSHKNLVTNIKYMKTALNEVVLVIKALSTALDGSLCSQQTYNATNIDEIAMKELSLLEDEILLTKKSKYKLSLKSCLCEESFCIDSTCPEPCKVVCWHKFNLGRWGCQAVDESTSVPLDMLCDGKLDCYDETDEVSCNTGATFNKFEANDMYNTVLKILQTNSASKDYLPIRKKLLSLYTAINNLQKETSKPKPDNLNVKSIRDKCYSYLVSIYEDMINNGADIDELHDTQLFLLTLNEKLGTALKLSHSGNDKVISKTGCVCKESQCLLTQCSKNCERACSVKPKLTKYWCEEYLSNNISIPIERVCNKNAECPLQDDEAQCSIDVCRKHHVLVLRNSIQDVGEKQKGTSLGETLTSWKLKVTSMLKTAENSYRPTPTTLREILNDILNDLVMAYASMDQNIRGRSTDDTLKIFFEISQRVIRSLKSCGQ